MQPGFRHLRVAINTLCFTQELTVLIEMVVVKDKQNSSLPDFLAQLVLKNSFFSHFLDNSLLVGLPIPLFWNSNDICQDESLVFYVLTRLWVSSCSMANHEFFSNIT